MDEQINTANQTSAGMFPDDNIHVERTNEVPKARPDQYINTSSATIIMLIKLLEGGTAGFFLYHLFRVMAPIIGEAAKGVSGMTQYSEFAEKVEKYDENNLSPEEYKYYINVMSRVDKRLIDVAGKTEQ